MHTEYTRLMSLALDHEASQDELQRLRAHLQDCPACAAVWSQWRALDRRLAAAPQVAPPASLAGQVLQRLAERELRQRRTRWVGSGLLLTWLVAFLLGSAGIWAAVDWIAAHPQQIAAALSGLAYFLSGVTWLARQLAMFLGELGAPRLAAGAGLFTTLTCLLAVMWLYVMGHNRPWVRSAGFAPR